MFFPFSGNGKRCSVSDDVVQLHNKRVDARNELRAGKVDAERDALAVSQLEYSAIYKDNIATSQAATKSIMDAHSLSTADYKAIMEMSIYNSLLAGVTPISAVSPRVGLLEGDDAIYGVGYAPVLGNIYYISKAERAKLRAKAEKAQAASASPMSPNKPDNEYPGEGERYKKDQWSEHDKDYRDTDKSYEDALDKAFEEIESRTGLKRDQFKVTGTSKDINDNDVPTEWTAKVDGKWATVNIDETHGGVWNKDNQTGSRWESGPDTPHIGWQSGKGPNKVTGHILVDEVPYGRTRK